jgi:hypothetical protein
VSVSENQRKKQRTKERKKERKKKKREREREREREIDREIDRESLVLWFWFCRRRGGGIGGPEDFGVLRDCGRRLGETGKKRMKLLASGGGGCFEIEFWR